MNSAIVPYISNIVNGLDQSPGNLIIYISINDRYTNK
jgi:hypothetical protein